MDTIHRISVAYPRVLKCVETQETHTIEEWAELIAQRRGIRPASVIHRLRNGHGKAYRLTWETVE